ncbi:zinc-binding dehydrogenase [Cupriavidus sp. BIS7]|uniref:zinc-binding dehydrogenase n=1 Tax=Cupriavidus sp. BIS7 TaxID=1217718 RepID=UPI0002E4762D|nr:zinc-binding dehydrogenase [Cupriavidus sp. BIS7]
MSVTTAPNGHKAKTGLQLRSLIRDDGELELSLVDVEVPAPQADEVVVRVEASPINPSDIANMFSVADMNTAQHAGTAAAPVVTARIPKERMSAVAGRIGQSMPVGNEGAGVVVEAGSSAEAQALLGRTVALLGGAMYSQYRCVKASQCMALPDGTTPAEGAACFVNPLTALGMIETMRHDGHRALVHTAAASNLGQMLNRICLADGIPLVNVVRDEKQASLLRSMGATHVCNSTAPTFIQDLTQALAETGATIAFDAVGGGPLASQILGCMEAALTRSMKEYSRYGSPVHKQVYLYGTLDPSPTMLSRNFGVAYSVGGWLLTPFLQKIGPAREAKLRERIVAELKTTFASHYTKAVSLVEALQLDEIAVYGKRATGTKYLINPNKGVAR